MGAIDSMFLAMVNTMVATSDNKGVFSYDTVLLVNYINSLKIQTDNMDVVNVSWASLGEQSKVFEIYVDGYMHLQEIIRLYQQLLYNNIKSLDTITKNMLKLDVELAKQLK